MGKRTSIWITILKQTWKTCKWVTNSCGHFIFFSILVFDVLMQLNICKTELFIVIFMFFFYFLKQTFCVFLSSEGNDKTMIWMLEFCWNKQSDYYVLGTSTLKLNFLTLKLNIYFRYLSSTMHISSNIFFKLIRYLCLSEGWKRSHDLLTAKSITHTSEWRIMFIYATQLQTLNLCCQVPQAPFQDPEKILKIAWLVDY